jgi:hypothetical protein
LQSAIRGNVSTGDGGGISMGTGTLTAAGSKITNNVAKGSGGGVNSGGAVTLNQSVVSNNFANTGLGGGVRANSVTVTGSSILQNQAGRDGGGVSALFDIDVSKSIVSNNRNAGLPISLPVGGGGLETQGGNITVTDSTVSFNDSASAGGGIEGVNIVVTRSKIIGNTARLGGGGMEGTAVNVTASTVSDNSVDSFDTSVACDGGGIWGLTDVTLSQSTVSNNFARDDGGGIYVFQGANIDSSTLSGNSTSIDDSKLRFGGGIKAAIAHLTNTTINGNMSFLGGGVSMESGSLINSTVTRNTAFLAGGVLNDSDLIGASGQIAVLNSIIAQDFVLPGGSSADVAGQFQSVGHNLIGDVGAASGFGAQGSGDLVGTTANPIDARLGDLANNGGPTLTHALLKGSPAIDAGSNNVTESVDQRGRVRIRDGNGDGVKTIDIGAFER